MNRERIILIASLLVIAAVPVVYFLNPFQTASADPRARLAGGTIYRMPSRNMEPTIREGDTFVVNSAALSDRDPEVGEIVVFKFPPNPGIHYIMRVVATGGSTIEMRAGVVWLDGRKLDEPWLPAEPIKAATIEGQVIPLRQEDIYADLPPTLVPEQHLFVLGDNRGNSSDSRVWGFVPREMVIGVYARSL